MIPIPVETIDLLVGLNLPKEMADKVIFKEHKGLVLETIRSLVLDNYYQDAISHDYPDLFSPHPKSLILVVPLILSLVISESSPLDNATTKGASSDESPCILR